MSSLCRVLSAGVWRGDSCKVSPGGSSSRLQILFQLSLILKVLCSRRGSSQQFPLYTPAWLMCVRRSPSHCTAFIVEALFIQELIFMASPCFPVKISPDLINSFTDLFPCRKMKHCILSQLFLFCFRKASNMWYYPFCLWGSVSLCSSG